MKNKETYISVGGQHKKLFNLTPHTYHLYDNGAKIVLMSIPSVGSLRLTRKKDTAALTGEPIVLWQGAEQAVDAQHPPIAFGAPYVQPFNHCELHSDVLNEDALDGVALLVSMPVADFLAEHDAFWSCSLLIPDTGPDGAVRDVRGQICGSKGFILYRK